MHHPAPKAYAHAHVLPWPPTVPSRSGAMMTSAFSRGSCLDLLYHMFVLLNVRSA